MKVPKSVTFHITIMNTLVHQTACFNFISPCVKNSKPSSDFTIVIHKKIEKSFCDIRHDANGKERREVGVLKLCSGEEKKLCSYSCEALFSTARALIKSC
jgi:hypothetical protein